MYLQSFTPNELTHFNVSFSLKSQQCVVLRGAIDPAVARTAFAAFNTLMRDVNKLALFPFNKKNRLGYTPPGVETLQRDSEHPDWNRSMFDFSPELTLGEPSIAQLYEEAVIACRLIRSLLDKSHGTELAALPEGKHTLRTALSLREGTSVQDIMFPRHRDFSLLTAFLGSNVPGLEIEVDGMWRATELEYGDVLIGSGTPLRQFCPEIQPLWHRIVGGTDYRLSSFLFFDLGATVRLPISGELYGDMLARVLKSIRGDG